MVRVLLVDDDPVVLKLMHKALEGNGVEHDQACSAEEALEQLQLRPYGILVTDLILPGLDGVDLYQRARHQRPLLRGILCSAHLDYETMLRVIETGFDDTFVKPISDLPGLVDSIRRSAERLQNWKQRIAELRGFPSHVTGN